MRFLCLHGRGTNAETFKGQTEQIREAIGQDHEFVFINGCYLADSVPGINSIAATKVNERRAFVPLGAEPQIYRAFFADLRQFVQNRGPFDGLIGFSEGASIATTLMAEDAARPFAGLKCAVLFCALDAADPGPIFVGGDVPPLRLLNPAVDGVLVRVPTAHVWSSSDDVAHGGMSQRVAALFDEDAREDLVHSLGHDIPGSRSDEYLQEAIRVIERTIERARAQI